MKEYRPVIGQHPAGLVDSGSEKSHVVFECIEVRSTTLSFCPIPVAAESGAVTALVAHGFEASDRLLGSCVEGRVDVDQVDRGIWNFTKEIEVVGEIYRVLFHDRF